MRKQIQYQLKTHKNNMNWLKKYWAPSLVVGGVFLWLLINSGFLQALPITIVLIGILGIIKHFYETNLKQIKRNSSENKSIPEYESEKLFELGVLVKALLMALTLGSAIIAFLGYQGYQTLKQELTQTLIQKVDPEQKLKILEETTKRLDSLTVIKMQEIDSLNKYNSLFIENINEYKNQLLPIGSIIAFDGRKKIPDGWAICDGKKIDVISGRIVDYTNENTLATPNLVNRFIIGTTLPGNEDVEFGLGEMGGSKTHSHKFRLEINSETLENIPLSGNAPTSSNLVFIRTTSERGLGYLVNHTHKTIIRKENNVTENSTYLPPYYALIFIIKYK